MQADGDVDLLMQLLPGLHVMRSKPATHSLCLQVGKKALSKLLICARIADEAGVELKGCSHQRTHELDKVVGNTGATQKLGRDLAPGKVNRVNANGRRPNAVSPF